MRTVNEKTAIEHINKDELVLIYWAVSNCPNCTHFNDTLTELEDEHTSWTFLKVSLYLSYKGIFPLPHSDYILDPDNRQLYF